MTNATTVLAAGTPAETWPGMGIAGTVVFLAICLGTFLLWKNMNRQIKKVDSNLPTADELMQADIAAGTADPRMAARYRAREARRRQVGPNAIIGTGPITTGVSASPAAAKMLPKPVSTATEQPHGTPPWTVLMAVRPNVVVILSDDHGYADRGVCGVDPSVLTPHLDALAAAGVTCTDAYVTAPICSPSRAGLIAGRYQARWGVHWFGDSTFPSGYPSIAERFTELGYATGYLGKVHYGKEDVGDRGCPPHHGFAETFYGLAGQQMGRLNYLHHSDAAVDEYGPAASWRMAVQPMLEGDQPVELEGFLTDELGRRACEFITRHEGEPFFLQVAFNAVHNFCWQLPAEELRRRGLPGMADWTGDAEPDYLDWYDGVVAPNLEHGREYYLAQLELMDTQIGNVLGTLEQLGLADDTIVVYLTDNGGSTCNYADNNTPLRGTKYTLWEGGIRVPFLVRWPAGGIHGGRACDGVVSSMDLYPSLLAAAGADASAYADADGRDQLELWRGRCADGHSELHWDVGYAWAVRVGQWKLSYVDGSSETAAGLRIVEHAEPGDGRRLTDLHDDPGETRDLAEQRPDVVADLLARHEAWVAEVAIGVS